MSATRDQSQKFTFMYTNLHHLYRKGKEAAKNSPNILKTDDLRKTTTHKVEPYRPVELLSKKVEEAAQARDVASTQPLQTQAVQSLKTNLESLHDIQKRLRFLLKDLETVSNSKKPKE